MHEGMKKKKKQDVLYMYISWEHVGFFSPWMIKTLCDDKFFC